MMENGKQIQMNTDNQQCKEPTKPKKKGRWISVTLVVTIYASLVTLMTYMMRNNLSVAIVAMKEQFDWDENIQGVILASFYYGYVATNLLGGRASDYFGAKRILGMSVVVTAILSLATPVAAYYSTWLIITIRVAEGMAQGVIFPGINSLIGSWSTVENRSKVSMRINSGTSLGVVLALPISGALAESDFLGGWPSIFYVIGAIGLVVGVAFLWVVKDDPRQHPTISDEELQTILSGCVKYANSEAKDNKIPVPWKSIFTSFPFWVTAIAHVGNDFGFFFLISVLPTYMDEMLHFDLSSNGLLSALPYLCSWFFAQVYSPLIVKFIVEGKISVLNSRKLSMGIGTYGPMLGIVLLCIFGTNSTLAVVILILGGAMNSAIYSGYNCSQADISPRFVGTLHGISNTLAGVGGFIAPMMTGAFTNNNQTLKAWRTVFLIVAAIYFVSVTQYIVFATDKVQPWDDPTQEAKKENEANDVEHAKIPSIVVDSVDTRL